MALTDMALTDVSTVRRAITKAISVLCWLSLLPMTVLAIARLLQADTSRAMAILETISFYLLAPSYLILLFALLTRRQLLVSLAAVIAALHLFWFFPEIAGHRPDLKTQSSPSIRIFSQNVMFDNTTPDKVGDQIRTSNADIVMLQEVSDGDYDALREGGALAEYPYSYVRPDYSVRGLGIFSKYPLSNTQLIASPGFPQMRAIVSVNGRPLVLWNVHIRAPIDGPPSGWAGDLSQLAQRTRNETSPALVTGDFNSTWSHRPFRNLIRDGYHEAAVDLGHGFSRTWPVNTPNGLRFGGFVRFDHVILSRQVHAVSQVETPGNGSDHQGLITTISLS